MKHFGLFISCLYLAIISVAQSNPSVSGKGKRVTTYTYKFDYSDPNPGTPNPITPRHKKDRVFVSVDNINRLAFDIKPSDATVAIDLPRISLFDSLASTLKTGNINATTPTVTEPVESQQKTRQVNNRMKNGKMQKTTVTVTVKDPYFEKKKRITELQKTINSEFPDAVAFMQSLEFFSKFAQVAPSIAVGERYSQQTIKDRLINEMNIQQFYPGLSSFSDLQSVIATQPVTIVKDLNTKIDIIKSARKEANALLAEIEKQCKENKTRDEDFCDVSDLEDNYPPDLDKALEQADKIKLTQIIEVANELQSLFIKVNDDKNFSFGPKYFEPKDDYISIKLLFVPNAASAKNFTADSIVVENIPVKGKFEWAIGPSLNFHLTESLFNFSYHIDSAYGHDQLAKKDTFNLKKNTLRNKAIPSIGIMAHFYWQNHASVTPGIAIGLSTSPTELSDLRAYLGGSLLIGDLSNRVIFSAGLAFGSVDRLKPNLKKGENPKSQIPFNGETIGAPADFVEKTFKFGAFMGLTYKLN
jgi:hypothetical protein